MSEGVNFIEKCQLKIPPHERGVFVFSKRLSQLEEVLLGGILVIAKIDYVEIQHVAIYLYRLVV